MLLELHAFAAFLENLEDRSRQFARVVPRFFRAARARSYRSSATFPPTDLAALSRASSNSVQNSRSLMRTTKSCEVKPKTRTRSMASAINSASASAESSPMMSQLSWKCSRKPAALLFLVTKTLRNREPFQRLSELPVLRRDDARQRGRHFRPQRHRALAFVDEIVQLPDDFRRPIFFVELELFQDRSVQFHEAVAAGDFAPFREDVISFRAGSGKKIAKSGKGLHTGSETKGNHWGVTPGDASTDLVNLRTFFAVE